jgi:hypothetical protein
MQYDFTRVDEDGAERSGSHYSLIYCIRCNAEQDHRDRTDDQEDVVQVATLQSHDVEYRVTKRQMEL